MPITTDGKELDFKVETKPTFWSVCLSTGAYSDYEDNYLYFHANDEDEVWNFLCRYHEATYSKKKYDEVYYREMRPCLAWKEKRFTVANPVDFMGKPKDKEDLDWDSDYGDAASVSMDRLNVIEFQK